MATKQVCALYLCVMTVTAYCESPSPVSVSIPVDKIVDALIDAIKSLNATVRADSVGQLARDLSNLAGQEDGLAVTLKSWQSNDGSIHISAQSGGRVTILEGSLDGIRKTYIDIQTQMNAIDPVYARDHTQIVSDIGGFAHDGILFYCPPAANCEARPDGFGFMGPGSIVFTNAVETNNFIAKLEADADQLRRLALQLATGNKPAY